MGDPKKQKKKYRKPLMVWNEERIARDKELLKNFGLKNKREIWKVESELKSIHDQAKKLTAQSTEQSKKEAEQLIKRLNSLNLVQQDAKLDNILSLTIHDLLNRRLQTVVFKKGLARTVNQARQFITHNHISINSQIINIPSYIVPLKDEAFVNFNQSSTLASLEHPERIQEEETKILEKIKPKESKEPEAEEKKTEGKKVKKTQQRQKKPKKLKKEEQIEDVVQEGRKTHKEK